MRNKLLTFLFIIPLLTSCSDNIKKDGFFAFDTRINISIENANEDNLSYIKEICLYLDKLSDNYQARDIANVYSINQSNEDIKVDKDLYDLLKSAYEVNSQGASNFNLMCGSLAKLWKSSIEKSQIPDILDIQNELNKIQNSSLLFKDDNVIQRIGEAEIDLGGYVKGYSLDKIKDYLKAHELTNYIINAGNSSVLLGEKNNGETYKVGIKGLDGYLFKLKNCVISTSGTLEQSVVINDKTYSHIVNPYNGDAEAKYDSVVVISKDGAFSDAMSTSLFMATEEEMIKAEEDYDIRVIAIKDNNVFYMNNDVEFDFH